MILFNILTSCDYYHLIWGRKQSRPLVSLKWIKYKNCILYPFFKDRAAVRARSSAWSETLTRSSQDNIIMDIRSWKKTVVIFFRKNNNKWTSSILVHKVEAFIIFYLIHLLFIHANQPWCCDVYKNYFNRVTFWML